MRRTIILIILFITNYSLLIVNAQSTYFNKRIDITNGDWDLCTSLATNNNGYLVVGNCGPGRHIFLSRLGTEGNIDWTNTYDTPSYTYYIGGSGSLFQTKDKYYAFCGGRVLWPTGHSILIKVDSLGNKKWEREYELTDCSNTLNSGNVTKDSGYILTGDAYLSGPKYKYLLLKTDSLGNQQWYKTFTDNDPNRNYAGNSVIQTPDKGYCLGGYGGHHPTPNYYYIAELIKTDSMGNQKWKKTFGNPLYCNWGTMLSLSKDSCIVATYSLAFSSDIHGNRQVYIAKFGLDGSEKWNRAIGFPSPNNWSSWIQTLSDGSFIISGTNAVKDTITKHIGWLFKLNSNGDSLWYREYAVINGINDANELWQVTPTPDKGFACAGTLYPNSAGGSDDIWVFKTDSMGCLIPRCDVGITEFNQNAGAQMLIYPNPFTNAFAINYNIPKESKKGVFELYDVYGSIIYSTPLTLNVNQLQVVASSLMPGIYFASLFIDGEIVSTEKVIKN